MRRVVRVVVVLFGVVAAPAMADHPPAGESELTRAERRVLGADASVGDSGIVRVPLDDGSVLRTHGPDPAPADPGEALTLAGPSDRFLPGAAEREPVCATDYAMQVLYARTPASADRLAEARAGIRSVVRRSNHVLNQEAIASGGGGGDYKVVCDDAGAIDVRSYTTTGLTFSGAVDAARAAGFSSRSRNYAIFLDERAPGGYCGVGSMYLSDDPGLSNPHNTNGGYAVIYKGCWEGTTFMHEVGHNRGAVSEGAPGSTGSGGHCNEGHDVMCYAPDGGDRNQSMVYPCPAVTRFDCNFDTYFDAAPESGEYLARHWNLGREGQNFLTILPAGSSPPPPPEADTTPPETRITLAPRARTRSRLARFSFAGTDGATAAGALTFRCAIDGRPFARCTAPKVFRGLTRGRHTFAVRAIDEAGNADPKPATFSWRVRRR